jgi:hypothetical protein
MFDIFTYRLNTFYMAFNHLVRYTKQTGGQPNLEIGL